MTHEEADSVKHLAPDVMKVLEKLDMECPQCRESGCIIPDHPKGKVKYSWTPKVGEWCIWHTLVRLIDGVDDFTNEVGFVVNEMSCLAKNRVRLFKPTSECTPILHWEEIERVLEGAGWYLKLNHYDSDLENGILYEGSVFVAKFDKNPKTEFIPTHEKASKSRQEAVMLAIIELGRELWPQKAQRRIK